MSNLRRVGSELYYTLYDENDQIVGDIDKTSTFTLPGDPDCAIYVTLPCGHETRFWAHYFTDEQYIDAANRIKQLDNETK